MNTRTQNKTIHHLHFHQSRAVAQKIESPDRQLAGHPALIAVGIAALLALALGLLLSNIQVADISASSWTLFG